MERNKISVEMKNCMLHNQEESPDDSFESDGDSSIIAEAFTSSNNSDNNKQVTKFDKIKGEIVVNDNLQQRSVQQVLNNPVGPKNGDSNISELTIAKSSEVHVGNNITTNYQGPVTIIYSNSTFETSDNSGPIASKDINKDKENSKEFRTKEKELSTVSSLKHPFQRCKVKKWLCTSWSVVVPSVIVFLAIIIILCAQLINSKNSKGSTDTSNSHQSTDIPSSTSDIPSSTSDIPTSTTDISTTTSNNTSINDDELIVTRQEWGAFEPVIQPPKLQIVPTPYAIISHTSLNYKTVCLNKDDCREAVQCIGFLERLIYGDITWNFLIGGDGHAYEGRGWNIEGDHTKNYNNMSIGIAFIGDFMNQEPTKVQLDAALKLLTIGEKNNKLTADYKLLGVRQVASTENPGDIIFNIIKTWKHWSPTP